MYRLRVPDLDQVSLKLYKGRETRTRRIDRRRFDTNPLILVSCQTLSSQFSSPLFSSLVQLQRYLIEVWYSKRLWSPLFETNKVLSSISAKQQRLLIEESKYSLIRLCCKNKTTDHRELNYLTGVVNTVCSKQSKNIITTHSLLLLCLFMNGTR